MSKTLFTGKWMFTGCEVIEDFALVTDGGLITWVGQRKDLSEQDFDRKEDLGEGYVTPGFIDCHVHLFGYGETSSSKMRDDSLQAENTCLAVYNAKQLLSAGIVACRDLGSPNGNAIGLREAINKRYVLGPHVVAAGRSICVTGGHGYFTSIECDGKDEIRKGVRQVVKDGADVVKIMVSGGVNSPGPEPGPTELTYDEIKAGVDAAHALGRKVSVHTHGNTAIRLCVEAGADSIEHGVYMTEDIMDMMVEKGIFLVPTLSAPYYAAIEGLKEEPDNPDHAESKAVINRHRIALLTSFKKGVKIALGTDAGSPYNRFDKAAYELVLMVDSGFKPIEALTVATKSGAELLGIDDKYGTLEIGKKASFLSFRGNPCERIEAVMEEKDVYLEGERINIYI
ncbi:MAG: amidohydrolase family protein [Firmicutes bacterium]|nr:amidohydrolase family protein [Bacillota bacterium]